MSEKKSLDPPCQLLFKTLLAPNGKQCWGVTSCIDWAYFKIFTFFIFPFFFWMGIHGIRIRKELLAVCKFVHDIRPVDSEKYLLLICSQIFIWFLLFWKLFLRKISYTIHYLQAFSWKTYNTKAKNTHFVWKCLYIYIICHVTDCNYILYLYPCFQEIQGWNYFFHSSEWSGMKHFIITISITIFFCINSIKD